MDLDYITTDISLSVIIICDQQWSFIFDAITSVEACLETVDEILIATSHFLDYEEKEVYHYLINKGYSIERFDENLNLDQILDFCINKVRGKYIFPILAEQIIFRDTLITAVDILNHQSEVGLVYSDVEFLRDNNRIFRVSDFSFLFRKKLWEERSIEGLIVLSDEWEAVPISPSLFHQRILLDEAQNINQDLFKRQPLVSVCIPTYNGERFIAEAISSILSQTYSRLEIIISDDGSRDQTVKIAKSFKEKTSVKIYIFVHEPLGLAENCNFAVYQANGKYVKFLFQDDLLAPDCITKMVELAEQNEDIGLVFSPREICFVDEVAEEDRDLISVYQDFQNIHHAWSNLQPIQWGQALLSDPHLLKHPINKIGEPSTVLIRRDIFDKVGGFDPQLNQLVDLDLWLRIMGGYQVGFVNQVLSYFRLHTEQKTYQNIAENCSTDLKFYAKFYSDPNYHFLPDFVRNRALCIYTLNLNHFYLYFSDETSGTFLEDIRLLRREVAEYWRGITLEDLEQIHSSPLIIVYRILLRNKSLKQEPLTSSEQLFVQEIRDSINPVSTGFETTRNILALLLYQHPNQLPLTWDLGLIPQTLSKDVNRWKNRG